MALGRPFGGLSLFLVFSSARLPLPSFFFYVIVGAVVSGGLLFLFHQCLASATARAAERGRMGERRPQGKGHALAYHLFFPKRKFLFFPFTLGGS
ncbi:hypothetical protein [Pandoravirus japonicus]|uniref:Uncharacterized protein n=1 Tax=Pandoravirus japonicus TaxID=2823154 RepID=A0A811BRS5_9VIRU|nr:hypothetical protein [Pandoravirus japonicus]